MKYFFFIVFSVILFFGFSFKKDSKHLIQIENFVKETDSIFKYYDAEFRIVAKRNIQRKIDSLSKLNIDSIDVDDKFYLDHSKNIIKRIESKDTFHLYHMSYAFFVSKDGFSKILFDNISDCENIMGFMYKNEIRVITYENGCSPSQVFFYKNGKVIYAESYCVDSTAFIVKHYFKNGKCIIDHSNINSETYREIFMNKSHYSNADYFYKRLVE